jgi:molybdate-binding protein
MGGLKSLQRGICHIAVCHLLQNADQEYNFGFAEQEFVNAPVLVNFSRRQQGLLVPKGNPKNILGLTDLTRENVTMVNRPLGTGTRVLVDYEITEAGISSAKIDGYHNVVSRHLDAGLEVLSGKVDAAPAIQAVAGILGLDFIPLRWERFDLLILREKFFDKKVQTFINLLHGKSFHELAENYEGYDVSSSGKILYPNNLKKDDSVSAGNNNWLETL